MECYELLKTTETVTGDLPGNNYSIVIVGFVGINRSSLLPDLPRP